MYQELLIFGDGVTIGLSAACWLPHASVIVNHWYAC